MLYTKKGDDGTTKAFDTAKGKRISKSSCQIESLGALDEVNSFLGLVRVKSAEAEWSVNSRKPQDIILWVQNTLFILQAEAAGSDKRVSEDHVSALESLTDSIEKELPPIKSFFISGGTELAAILDVARTLARKAERRVIAGMERGETKIGAPAAAFLNRLSSLLYAMARLTNHKSGINEVPPSY